jgi:inorganic triphosphatase YgiF
MAVETELKLRIAPEQLARLKRHTLLKAHSATRPVTRRLQNIYYDTPDLELHSSGMALRLRHAGQQWLQTLKGGGSVQAGLHRRNEWEVPVRSAKLDFSFLSEIPGPQAAGWEERLPLSLRKKLHPVFVTDFSRTSRMLDFQGAQIELCMDQGEVRTEQRSMPICELELELKSGNPRQLFELAQAILEIVPLELETVSKAEQGYRLLSGYTEHPVKGVAPFLARTDTLADALKMLIWSCQQHFQGNLHGVMGHGTMAGDDAEYLHQMRVALRRLRVVLRMAEKVRADRQLAGLYKDASDLCVALGRIREWDVFIAQTVLPMCARMPGHAGLQALLAASERQRADCYTALRGPGQAREWQKESAHQAQDFATRRLRKLAKRFALSAQQLDTADAARLHALRILAKKLRYSAEFFAGLYDKRKTGPYLAALSEVQDVLGQINDAAAAHRLLDALAADDALATHQEAVVLEAVVLTRGWIAHEVSAQLTVLLNTIQRFNKQAAFWENK